MVEADVVRPAGRPVLHVAQVGVPIDQHVSAAEQRQQSEAELECRRRELCHRSVPAVQRGAVTSHRERGQPPLELPEARGGRDVGAQQVAAVDVPDRRRRKQQSHTAKSVGGGPGRTHSLFVTLDPGVLVLPAVAFLRPFDVQLLVTELVGRRRLWRGHDGKKEEDFQLCE